MTQPRLGNPATVSLVVIQLSSNCSKSSLRTFFPRLGECRRDNGVAPSSNISIARFQEMLAGKPSIMKHNAVILNIPSKSVLTTTNYQLLTMRFTCVLLVALIGFFVPAVEARCRIQALGCWRDKPQRAVPPMEGSHPALKGNYKARKDAIVKCRDVAASRGMLHHNIWFTIPDWIPYLLRSRWRTVFRWTPRRKDLQEARTCQQLPSRKGRTLGQQRLPYPRMSRINLSESNLVVVMKFPLCASSRICNNLGVTSLLVLCSCIYLPFLLACNCLAPPTPSERTENKIGVWRRPTGVRLLQKHSEMRQIPGFAPQISLFALIFAGGINSQKTPPPLVPPTSSPTGCLVVPHSEDLCR
eukprot:sb/3466077/